MVQSQLPQPPISQPPPSEMQTLHEQPAFASARGRASQEPGPAAPVANGNTPRPFKTQPPLAAVSIPAPNSYDRRRVVEPPTRKNVASYSSDSIEAIPLPPRTQSVETYSASSPFDQIAQAAVSNPPLPGSMTATDTSIDPDTDLPMPVEHLQLPGLREGSAAFPVPPVNPYTSRTRTMGPRDQVGTGSDPSRRLNDDPWHNPSAALPRQQPYEEPSRAQSSLPPISSSRPYPGNAPVPSQSPVGTPREQPMAFDEEHYRVVYNEFVGSKARLGEVVDNITYEGFSSKLRSSEKELIDRHGCKAVRFQVLVKDRQVSLRPQLVR
jgi:hypothetical protein